MNVFIRAMVRIFSFGERWNILFNSAIGKYSYIRVLPDEFLLKSVVIRVDFKRKSSGRTRIYEYAPPPPQLTL